MRNEADAYEQVSTLATCHEPLLIGVRHHSPVLATSTPMMLDDFAPGVFAIELPAEVDEWLSQLSSAHIITPVVLASSRGEDLSFYPFTDFSSELATLCWAAARGVRVSCIDRPIAAREEKSPPGEGSGTGGTPNGETLTGAADHEMKPDALREENDPREKAKDSQVLAPTSGGSRSRKVPEIAVRARDGDSAESWDRLIKVRAPSLTPEQIRVATLAHGQTIRVDEAKADEDSLEHKQ